MQGYKPETYGDAFADVYDDWYHDVSSPTATAAFVSARTSGPVLELGSGTGRLAGPMRAAGLAVVGLDASTAMLARSRAGHPRVPIVRADMAAPPVRDGSCGAVVVAFNTLFNLPSEALQRRALVRAAEVIGPDGFVVVEAFVPVEEPDTADAVDVVRLDMDLVVLRVSRVDAASSTVHGHHIELRDGEPVRLRPWQVRFCSPEVLDAYAADAGLVRRERFADWDETPYTAISDRHVSVYGPASGRR